jgi:hypothetical protein
MIWGALSPSFPGTCFCLLFLFDLGAAKHLHEETVCPVSSSQRLLSQQRGGFFLIFLTYFLSPKKSGEEACNRKREKLSFN